MSFCLFDGTGDVATSNLTTAITGDLDVRAKIRATDWTPAASTSLVVQSDAQWGWSLFINTNGTLGLLTSANGSSVTIDYSTAVLATAAGLTDNVSDIWVRVTHDRDNGGGVNHDTIFYYGTDGVNWTKLGNTVTAAGVAAIFDSGAPITVGATGLTGGVFTGRIYSAEIRNSIAGTIVANPAFDAAPWDKGETVNVDGVGNTWTLTNAVLSADAWALTGAAVSAVSAAALLKLTRGFAGVATSAVSAAGALKLGHKAPGVAVSAATVAGALKLGHQLAGASLDVSTVSSTLKLGHRMLGAAASVSTAAASLKLLHQLVGAVTGSASVAGSLNMDIIRRLQGAATSNTAAAGALKLLHQLYGNPALTSVIAARLSVYGNIGTATIAETLQGLATIVETGPN